MNEKFASYDAIHAFSTVHGMYAIVEEAKKQGVKVALSPVLQPETRMRKFQHYRLLDRLVFQLSDNVVKTTFVHIQKMLQEADLIFALSALEANVISQGYRIAGDKVVTLPNGIDTRFFQDGALALPPALAQLQGYVFVSASVSDYKNQLAVIEATDRPVVLAGLSQSPAYLQKCLQAGGQRVHYVGALEYADPLLVSLYANAAVKVLASHGEASPLCIVESLACKTPAVVTKKNGLALQPQAPMLQYVDCQDRAALGRAIEVAAQATPAERVACRDMVASLSWDTVAQSMHCAYQQLLS